MTESTINGVIDHHLSGHKNDHLFRISVKGLIFNQDNHVLVVKEAGRGCWDLPGGGMDHGEDLKAALARELLEEVNLTSDFTYRVLTVDHPHYLQGANVIQIRIIFAVFPESMNFSTGVDADEVAFVDPVLFKDSDKIVERKIYEYTNSCVNKN